MTSPLALEGLFGASAGLSAPVITRLATARQADHQAFCQHDLGDRDYVYCWADGVHFRVRWSRPGSAVW